MCNEHAPLTPSFSHSTNPLAAAFPFLTDATIAQAHEKLAARSLEVLTYQQRVERGIQATFVDEGVSITCLADIFPQASHEYRMQAWRQMTDAGVRMVKRAAPAQQPTENPLSLTA